MIKGKNSKVQIIKNATVSLRFLIVLKLIF